MGKVLLIFVAVISGATIFVLSGKLHDGERQIRQGKIKLAKNDNIFVRTFFSGKFEAGKQQFADGEKKLAFWKRVRVLLVLVFLVCAVSAVMKFV